MGTWKDKAKKVVTRAERVQEANEKAVKEARRSEVETAQATAGLSDISVLQVQTYINNKLDNAENIAETKEAIKEILLKMVPYLLK